MGPAAFGRGGSTGDDGGGGQNDALLEESALEKLADVLEERKVELDALGLDEFAFLPFEKQREVQQRFRQRWLQSEDGKHFAQAALEKTSSKDAYHRTVESYYRKSQHEDYGGRVWQYCLVALGCLPPRQDTLTRHGLNLKVNRILSQKITR